MIIERPLDFLDLCRNKKVNVVLKNKSEIEGILLAFDIHVNIVMEINDITKFIRGDEVFCVEQNEQDRYNTD